MLVQGGSGHHIFSPSVYNYVRGMDVADIFAGIDEVPKPELKRLLKRLLTFGVYIILFSNILILL